MRRPLFGTQDGAQSLELAVALPLVIVVATLVAAVGQVVLAAAGTHQLAVGAARMAAVAHDSAVTAMFEPGTITDIDISPASGSRAPGDLVTVTLTRTVAVLWVPGPGLQVSAAATFRTEDVP